MTAEQAERLKRLIMAVTYAHAITSMASASPSGLIIDMPTGAVMTAEQARSTMRPAQEALDDYIDALVTP